MLYFDDLNIGMEFPPLKQTISREEILNYAEAVGDFNPLYMDEEYAASSKFKGLINHPTSAAILSINAYKTGEPLPTGIIHAKQNYKFFSPTRPGEKLLTKAKIIDKYIKRDKKYVVIQSVTETFDQQKRFESTSVVIWPK